MTSATTSLEIMSDRHQIDELIWQGQEPEWPENTNPVGDFDLLVLCFREGSFNWSRFDKRGFEVMRAPLDDDQRTLQPTDIPIAEQAAKVVAMRAVKGARCLVTCRMGLNRSGLVTALALRWLYGWSGQACLEHVRLKRPGSLSNPGFAAYLQGLPSTSSVG